MDIQEFIQKTIPISRGTGEELSEYLDRIFNNYIKYVNNLSSSTDPVLQEVYSNIDAIELQARQISQAINEYLFGNHSDAQLEFDKALSVINVYLERLTKSPTGIDGKGWIFRIRLFEDLHNKPKRELFHIPFNKRHLVGSQRFSLPGIPCLYAGSSSYVCWEELGRPLLDRMFTLGIRIEHPIKVLNLAISHNHILDRLNLSKGVLPTIYQSEVAEYLTCFPLIYSIHIKAAIPSATFKAEYIIPQLLLNWVRRHKDCIGIRYLSTHVNPSTSSHVASNFVFPTKSIAKEGHCAVLASHFTLTDPIPWSLLSCVGQWFTSPGSGEIFVIGETPIVYSTSAFGHHDGTIILLPTSPV